MNDIQIFKNAEFGSIRTVAINNEPWFVGKDIAEVLGYQNGSRDINHHVDEEDRKIISSQNYQNGTLEIPNRGLTVINESGLYSLILSSKLPNAKKFKHWVTSEVLPTIRKHGVYAIDELLDDPDTLITALTKLKDEREKNKRLTTQNAVLEQRVAEYEPKAQYVDTILSSQGAVTTTQIAADYGLSAKRLNQILKEERVQRNVGGQWILYREFMGLGYTKSETVTFTHTDGRPDTVMQTKWTQKGRLMIHNLLQRRGIMANMDRELPS